MNYNGILQLLDNGLSAEEVLITLKNASPKIAKKIQKYIAGGLSVPEVLKGLIQDPSIREVDISKSRGSSPSEVQSLSLLQKYNSVPESRDKESLRYLQKFTRQAINVGSMAGGAYALSRAIPKAVQAIPEAMKQILPGQQPNPQDIQGAIPGTLPQPGQITNNPQNPQQPPVNQPNITQQQQPIQPEVKTIDVKGLLEKSGLKKHVDELSQRTKDPKQIAALLYSKYPKEMKHFQAEAGKNMEDAIGDYLGESKLSPTEELTEKPTAEQQPKIEKSSIVASPNGVGEVKEIRNGQAVIDVDGKLHRVKESELEAEPEEVKQAKINTDLSKIPEDLRSAPLNEVYIPHDRRHVTVKYNAGLQPKRYIYFRKDGKPVSTDYINKIVSGVQLPVTSGKNFWGAWNAETSDSRGSANYHELVKNAQEEGEPDDPSKEYWFIQEEALYEHPYMEKKGKEELRQLEKEFNEKEKSEKRKDLEKDSKMMDFYSAKIKKAIQHGKKKK